MAFELKTDKSYRLIYFQPDPEDGERVCVALLFRDGRHYSISYDKSFPKLSCIAPGYEKGVLKLYLDELQETLAHAYSDERTTLKKWEPQIVASEERYLLQSVTDMLRQRLIERFLWASYTETAMRISEIGVVRKELPMDESIVSYIRGFVPPKTEARVLFHARPKQIIGRSLPNVSPIAASIRIGHKIVLVDGVDLAVGTARQVISKVNKVTHTFWEYGRAEREHLLTGTDSIQRVALVFNGTPHPSLAEKDAHDFALHQFKREADTVLTDRTADKSRLQELLTL